MKKAHSLVLHRDRIFQSKSRASRCSRVQIPTMQQRPVPRKVPPIVTLPTDGDVDVEEPQRSRRALRAPLRRTTPSAERNPLCELPLATENRNGLGGACRKGVLIIPLKTRVGVRAQVAALERKTYTSCCVAGRRFRCSPRRHGSTPAVSYGSMSAVATSCQIHTGQLGLNFFPRSMDNVQAVCTRPRPDYWQRRLPTQVRPNDKILQPSTGAFASCTDLSTCTQQVASPSCCMSNTKSI